MGTKTSSKRLQYLKQSSVWVLIFLCAALIIYPARPASADVAPPENPPGANPSPDSEVTQVRMMDEQVVIHVQEETDLSKMGTASVWAEFHMLNLGEVSETLMVRFPTSSNDGFSNYPEIEDMMVYIDNLSVPTSRIKLEGEPEQWDDPVQWAEFEVVFPPGEMVEIEVEYTLKGTGEYPFVSYSYLLETGAGWKGTIGSAEIIVRLPYEATTQTVFIDSHPGWGPTTTGAQLNGNEVSWYFEDFEPVWENNISISLVWPSAWHKVELERKNVAANPEDGEAWGRLGMIYKDISILRRSPREDPGGRELYQLSEEAYQQTLKLLPEDALWHAGYADLLFLKYYWTFYSSSEEGRDGMVRALEEIFIAYTLDPDHPYIKDYVEKGYFFPRDAVDQVGDQYVFFWLTQTPTLQPSRTAFQTPTIQISATEMPISTGTASPELQSSATHTPTEISGVNEEQSSRKFPLPICGSMIVFPFLLIIPLVQPLLRHRGR